MGNIRAGGISFLLIFFISQCLLLQQSNAINPKPPPSSPKISKTLISALRVIQRFKSTITCDPLNITKTWRGNKLCKDNSTYLGFICENQAIISLVDFNGYGFNGKPLALTNFLDELPDLTAFHANSNNFTGVVPVGPTNIKCLFELDLSNNELKGEFPRTILTAISLTYLDLRFNKLTGNIPPKVFTLDLNILYLNDNQFQGNIPDNLGKSPVQYLSLANNQLQGPIPKSIGLSSNTLQEALLLNNQLSGCLPYEIGLLKNATVFDVSMNKLTGPIPQSFGCLENIDILNLAQNQFYGEVPESVCMLGNLQNLTLNSNFFTKVGPECRKLIQSKVIDLSMNCISDLPSQKSAQECKAFFLKKHACPNPMSMNYVPCKIDNLKKVLLMQAKTAPKKVLLMQGKTAPKRVLLMQAKMMEPPRSYAALQRKM